MRSSLFSAILDLINKCAPLDNSHILFPFRLFRGSLEEVFRRLIPRPIHHLQSRDDLLCPVLRMSLCSLLETLSYTVLQYRALQLLRSVHFVALTRRRLVLYYAPRSTWLANPAKESRLQVGVKLGAKA